MKEISGELEELRYRFEKNVAQRTGQLLCRIEHLESCNAALCVKLAVLKAENMDLKQHAGPPDRLRLISAIKLSVVGNQA
jgi:hypothetical protein